MRLKRDEFSDVGDGARLGNRQAARKAKLDAGRGHWRSTRRSAKLALP
ncbi:MAG: hypothetical protein JNL97_12110 [Verrucomicrobiales bacterium]|nr:hypothetical protein [Verrucomicrobiales bacterium]